MKIEHLKTLIAEHFIAQNSTPTLNDAVLANLVLFQCANAPYFNNQSPLVLWECEPNIVQIGVLNDSVSSPQLWQMWDPLEEYYESNFGDYQPNQIAWPDRPNAKVVEYTTLSAQLQEQAHHHCQQLQSNSEIKKLFAPTPEEVLKRNTFTIEQCDTSNINDKLMEILGGYKDLGLYYSGIRYHDVPSVMNKAHWLFWVAHNGDEVAGVLGGLKMSDNDYAFRLSYVSVSPSFRQQGLAKQLYTQMLKYCSKNELIVLRSSPGKMTREMHEITHGFDKILLASSVPHLASNALMLETVVNELKHEYDWATFCQKVKPVCDKWLEHYPPSTSTWSINAMDKKRIFAQLKDLLPEHRAQQVRTPFM